MIQLKAEKREILGKEVNKLRREGLIPAELYGRGTENTHLSIAAKEFAGVYKEAGEHTLVNIEVDGTSRPVLIHDVEWSPIGQEILAVDLYEVRMDEKTKVHVPLEFVGQAPAVKEREGVLIKNMDEIEVEALPADLPEKITVNLTGLTELDQSIYVKDLPKGENYEFVIDPETVIVSVTPPAAEEIEEVIPGAAVEGEEKPREEEVPEEERAKKGGDDETET